MKTVQKWFVTVAMAFMLCLAGLVISTSAFSAGGGRCEDNGDGTVTDNGTGLMWQKDTAAEMTWYDARSYASGLSLGGHSDWRLPTKDELKGLFNSECKQLMDVRNSYYWSSTTDAGSTYVAWLVGFYYGGGEYNHDKAYNFYVRAVRARQ